MTLHPGQRVALMGLVALLCASCASVGPDRQYAGPREPTNTMRWYYSYPKRPIEARVEVREQKRDYDVLRIEFPSALTVFGDEDIRVDYYMSKRPGPNPTVLMLPISGGVDISVESFAWCFAPRGINCAIVHNRRGRVENTQSAEEVEAFFRQIPALCPLGISAIRQKNFRYGLTRTRMTDYV